MKNFVPGFTKMIVIDGPTCPGKSIEMPMEDHLSISGRNGCGKTTTLFLMTLGFLNPTQKVVTGSQRFSGYHLPRDSSCVVFEYENRDAEPCLMIISNAGGAITWRFAKTAYDVGIFVKDGVFVSGNKLSAQLDERGIVHSSKFDNRQKVRSILFGDPYTAADRADVTRHQGTYQICAASPKMSSLSNIGPILGATIQKQSIIQNLKGTIIDHLGANERFTISKDTDDIEQSVNDLKTLRDVSAHEGWFERASEIVAAHDLRTGIMTSLVASAIAVGHRLDRDRNATETRIQDSRASASAIRREAADAETRHRSNIKALRVESDEADRKARGLEAAKSEYDRYDVDKMRLVAGSRDDLFARKRLLAETQKAFADDTADANRIYQERKELIAQEKEAQQRILAGSRAAIMQESLDFQQDAEAELASRIFALNKRHEAELTTLNGERDVLRTAEAKLSVLSAEASEEVQNAVRSSAEAKDQSRDRKHAAEDAQRAAKRVYEDAKAAVSEADREIVSTERELKRAKAEEDALHEEIVKADRAFMGWARRNCPDRAEDLRRVLRKEVLLAEGLDPVVVPGSADAILGVGFDLNLVPATDVLADDADLREERLATTRKATETAETAFLTAQAARKTASKAFDAARTKLTEAEYRVQEAETRHVTAETAYKAAIAKEIAERSGHQERIRAERQEARAKVVAKEREISDVKTRRMAEQKSVQAEDKATRVEAQTLFGKRLASVDAAILDLDAVSKGKLTTAAQDRDRLFEEKGVSPAAQRAVEIEIVELNQQIDLATQYERELSGRDAFMAAEWPKNAEFRKRHAALAQEISRLDTNHALSQEAFTKRESDLSTEEETLKMSLVTIDDEIAACRNLMGSKRDLPEDGEEIADFAPKAGYARFLQVQAEEDKDRREGFKLARDITRMLLSHNSTPLLHMIDGIRAQHDEYSVEWLRVLVNWHSKERYQMESNARGGVATTRNAIMMFQNNVNTFKNGINRFSRDINAELSKQQPFKYLRNMKVEIRSRISEHGIVQASKAFEDAYARWQAGSAAALPTDDVIETLVRMRDLIDTQANENMSLSDLIEFSGSVEDDGVLKNFHSDTDMERISSNGLTLIFFIILYTAFISMIRNDRNIRIPFLVDEIDTLDAENSRDLATFIKAQNMVLITACPENNPDFMTMGNAIGLKKNKNIITTYHPTLKGRSS